MPVSDRATQQEIVEAVVNRLIDRIAELTDLNCNASDQREPVAWPQDRQCVIVSVGDGRYPEPFLAGGGASTICEQSTIDVTAWVNCRLDTAPYMHEALLNVTSGLWSYWKPAILRALLVSEDAVGNVIAWNPVSKDGMGLLRNQLAPAQCTAPRPDSSNDWLGITLSFAADFDWRL